MCGRDLEPAFLEQLARAPSNLPSPPPDRPRGLREVCAAGPARLAECRRPLRCRLALPVRSRKRRTSSATTWSRKRTSVHEAGSVKLVVGHARLDSEITLESWDFAYAALHLGDHNVNAGVVAYPGDAAYEEIAAELAEAFARVDTPQVLRLMDRAFGEASYSIASLFRDLQRQVLKKLLRERLTEITEMYQRVFDPNLPLMRFLQHLSAPIPMPLQATAEVLFNSDLRWALKDDDPDFEQIRSLVQEAQTWNVPLDGKALGYQLTKMLDRAALRWANQPKQLEPLAALAAGVDLARELPSSPTSGPRRTSSSTCAAEYSTRWSSRRRATRSPRNGSMLFLSLGEKLGIVVEPEKKRRMSGGPGHGSRPLVGELIDSRHVPNATYRLQLNSGFTFAAARDARSLLSRPRHQRHLHLADPPGAAGQPSRLRHLRPLAGQRRSGWGARTARSGRGARSARTWGWCSTSCRTTWPWATSRTTGGQTCSNTARARDTPTTSTSTGNPTNPDLEDKVLLPILGDQYGRTLESGQLRLSYGAGGFAITYYDTSAARCAADLHHDPLAPDRRAERGDWAMTMNICWNIAAF